MKGFIPTLFFTLIVSSCGGGGGGAGGSSSSPSYSYKTFEQAAQEQGFQWDNSYKIVLHRNPEYFDPGGWYLDPIDVSVNSLVAYYDQAADSSELSAVLRFGDEDAFNTKMLYGNDSYCEDLPARNPYWDDVCVTQEIFEWGRLYDVESFSVRGNHIAVDMTNQLGLTDYVAPMIFFNDHIGSQVSLNGAIYDFIPMVIGDATFSADVPTSGSISYDLASIGICLCDDQFLPWWDFELVVGSMDGQLTADFANKTISGRITFSYAMPYDSGRVGTYNSGYTSRDYVYEIEGTILGNRFTGEFTSEDGFTFYSIEGSFFGPAAREIGLTGYSFEDKTSDWNTDGFWDTFPPWNSQAVSIYSVIGKG